MEKKKIEVEDLNRIQREMEEKNKRRKAALSQEIFDRQKRAAAETKMLKTIEAELAKLDQLLNADVAVLRFKITRSTRNLFLIDFLEIKLIQLVVNSTKQKDVLIRLKKNMLIQSLICNKKLKLK